MDAKRKKERKEMETRHKRELGKLHSEYQNQTKSLQNKLSKFEQETQDDRICTRKFSSSREQQLYESQKHYEVQIDHLTKELEEKSKMLEEANDQIVCLKSKLHGLRTIVTQLRMVETKYKALKSKRERQKSK